MRRIPYIFMILLFAASNLMASQNDIVRDTSKNSFFDYIGVSYGHASTVVLGKQYYDYDYSADLFEVLLTRRIHEGRWFDLELSARPQLNATQVEDRKGIEFGINVAVSAVLSRGFIRPGFSIGVGPHYITESLERQAEGFIFSDNFRFFMRMHLSETICLSPHAGFRHLSNASLKQPNDGINSFIFGFALEYKLPQ